LVPYNLLLLPFIAGYIILGYSVIFKYTTQRYTQHRLLFESVFTCVILIFTFFIIRTFVEWKFPQVVPSVAHFLEVVPVRKVDYLWTSVFIFLFVIISVPITNLIITKKYGKDAPISWAIDKVGDEIETLFKRSAEEGILMQISLKNGKVYIGFCEIIPIPHKTNFLTLTPLLSGYRESESKKMIITTDYFNVVSKYISGLDSNNTGVTLNTDIIIRQDEILTANVYEQEIFDMFNKKTIE
jgi:hypothetical protein